MINPKIGDADRWPQRTMRLKLASHVPRMRRSKGNCCALEVWLKLNRSATATMFSSGKYDFHFKPKRNFKSAGQ